MNDFTSSSFGNHLYTKKYLFHHLILLILLKPVWYNQWQQFTKFSISNVFHEISSSPIFVYLKPLFRNIRIFVFENNELNRSSCCSYRVMQLSNKQHLIFIYIDIDKLLFMFLLFSTIHLIYLRLINVLKIYDEYI